MGTKLEVEQVKARADLEVEMKSLQEAGVEEASAIMVEDCPGCHMPQMNYDSAAKLIHCHCCEKDFCRKCWQCCPTTGACQKCLDEDFEVKNLLPRREFDEEDPMADEYRKAEWQFLRIQSKGRHTNLEIQSIDVVK